MLTLRILSLYVLTRIPLGARTMINLSLCNTTQPARDVVSTSKQRPFNAKTT